MLATRFAERGWRSAHGRRWLLLAAAAAVPTVAATAFASVRASPSAQAAARGTIVYSHTVGGSVELATIRPDGSGRRLLSRSDVLELHPRWRPGARWLVFERYDAKERDELGDHWSIWVSARDGRRKREVIRAFAEHPKWSPDGRWIAYQVPRAFGSGGRPTTGPADVRLVRPDGSQDQILLDAETSTVPWNGCCASWGMNWAWSPDGRRIAYGGTDGGIHFVEVATGRRRLVVAPTARYDVFGEPVWSPGGRRIAFVASGTKLFTVGVDGRGLRRLWRGNGKPLWGLSWSPDGATIAFAGIRRSPAEEVLLHLVSHKSARVRTIKLAPGDGVDGQPTWSPDGSSLALSDGYFVYRLDVRHGGAPVRIARGEDPDWACC